MTMAMAMAKLLCLITSLLAISTISSAYSLRPKADKCSDHVFSLASCLSYAIKRSEVPLPDKDCCKAVAEIVDMSPDCICPIVESFVGFGINMTRALELPEACSVQGAPHDCKGPSPSPRATPRPPHHHTHGPSPSPSPRPTPRPPHHHTHAPPKISPRPPSPSPAPTPSKPPSRTPAPDPAPGMAPPWPKSPPKKHSSPPMPMPLPPKKSPSPSPSPAPSAPSAPSPSPAPSAPSPPSIALPPSLVALGPGPVTASSGSAVASASFMAVLGGLALAALF